VAIFLFIEWLGCCSALQSKKMGGIKSKLGAVKKKSNFKKKLKISSPKRFLSILFNQFTMIKKKMPHALLSLGLC